jgi:flagellar basal-body rod protein FlgF
MDRMLYVAMSGAKETALAQARNTQNLANASTTGFKASLDAFASRHVEGPGHGTRTFAVTQDMRVDLSPGSLQTTGRDLDIAVQGEGWLAVLAPDGTEAYTRAGDLKVDAVGRLTTGAGFPGSWRRRPGGDPSRSKRWRSEATGRSASSLWARMPMRW